MARLLKVLKLEVTTFFGRLWTGLTSIQVRKVYEWGRDGGYGFIHAYGMDNVFLHASSIFPEPPKFLKRNLRGRKMLLLGWTDTDKGPRITRALQLSFGEVVKDLAALVDLGWNSFCDFLRQTPQEEAKKLLEAVAGLTFQNFSGLLGALLAAALGFYVFDLEPSRALAVVAVTGWWIATRVDYRRNQKAAVDFARVIMRKIPQPNQFDPTEPWEGGTHYEVSSVWGTEILRNSSPGAKMPVLICGMEDEPFGKQTELLVDWIDEVYPARFHLHGLLEVSPGCYRQVTGRFSASTTGCAGSLKQAERII